MMVLKGYSRLLWCLLRSLLLLLLLVQFLERIEDVHIDQGRLGEILQ